MVRFIAHMLIVLACWTLTIKFVFPIIFDLHYGHEPGMHIKWDFWWVVHLWLAYMLLNWHRHTYLFAIVVSVVEILIIVVKFALFLSDPEWDIWETNWFINKLFVLGCFILLLSYLTCFKGRALRFRQASA